MIPFDAVRNPFLQFNWLPCVNVGTTNISPYSLAIMTGVRNPTLDGANSGTVRDDLNVMLKVVGIEALSSLTMFEPAQLVFTGPTTMYTSTDAYHNAYGSCHTGDVGMWTIPPQSSTNYRLAPRPLNLTNYPRLVLPFGKAYGTTSVGYVHLVRLVRDTPIEVAFQNCNGTASGASSSFIDFMVSGGSGGLSHGEGASDWWFYTVNDHSVTIKYSGWYEVGFGTKCAITYGSSYYASATIAIFPGSAYGKTAASFQVFGDEIGGQQWYDAPYISARGTQYLSSGTEVGLIVEAMSPSTSITFSNLYFYVKHSRGA